MPIQPPQPDAIPIDLKDLAECRDLEIVFNVTLPEAGFEMDPRARLLFKHSLVVTQPLTPAETELVAHALRKGADYLKQLQQLPDGWDRDKVNQLVGWAQQLFEKPLAEKRGFNAQCHSPISSPRHDPGLGMSRIESRDVEKLLDAFGLNRKGRDTFDYLQGHVVAGQYRKSAKKLVVIYLDQHMSMPVQRRLITAFSNLYQDGVRTLALEGPEKSDQEMLAYANLQQDLERLQKVIDPSDTQSILKAFDNEAKRIKEEIKTGAPRDSNAVYYPALARIAVLVALMWSKGRILGVDDEAIIKDMNVVCWPANKDGLFPVEQAIYAEACNNYVFEFRSHLAVRNLKKFTQTNKDKEVVFLPFGFAHSLSLMGELLEDGYQNYSYLVVAPPEVLARATFEEMAWVNQMMMKAKAGQ